MATNPSAFVTPSGQLAQAATPLAGFALQNATPTIVTWTTPNDGKNHRIMLIADLVVTVAETGGQVQLSFTDPSSVPRTLAVFSGGAGTGFYSSGSVLGNSVVVAPGTAVSLVQSAALTVGAASVYAELWGS